MPYFEGLWTRLRHFVRNLIRHNQVELDLSDEIEGYTDLLIEEKVAHGMNEGL